MSPPPPPPPPLGKNKQKKDKSLVFDGHRIIKIKSNRSAFRAHKKNKSIFIRFPGKGLLGNNSGNNNTNNTNNNNSNNSLLSSSIGNLTPASGTLSASSFHANHVVTPGDSVGPQSSRPHKGLLKLLSVGLISCYAKCNPAAFAYSPTSNPRRVLTKPSESVANNGLDNEEANLILVVNDDLGGRYVVKDMLGSGTFGQVVKCEDRETRQHVAIKVIKNKAAYLRQAYIEINILNMLKAQYDPDNVHHIVRLYDYFTHANHLCLVFEQLSINLFELVKSNQFRGLSTNLIRVFLNQLLDALVVLQEANVIHCDLKPENILLTNLTSPQIKIIDFGSACLENQTLYSYIQSRFYRSPEVLLGVGYSSPIDMWSLGCICAELFLGLPLFPGVSDFNQICRIVEMIGMPPNHMVQRGQLASKFFKPIPTTDGFRFELKTAAEYCAENNCVPKEWKRYFNYKSLPELITHYPYRRDLVHAEIVTESLDRQSFTDFLLGVLRLDPEERWTPIQARDHPFILGKPFKGAYKPEPDYNKRRRQAMQTVPIGQHQSSTLSAHSAATLFSPPAPSSLYSPIQYHASYPYYMAAQPAGNPAFVMNSEEVVASSHTWSGLSHAMMLSSTPTTSTSTSTPGSSSSASSSFSSGSLGRWMSSTNPSLSNATSNSLPVSSPPGVPGLFAPAKPQLTQQQQQQQSPQQQQQPPQHMTVSSGLNSGLMISPPGPSHSSFAVGGAGLSSSTTGATRQQGIPIPLGASPSAATLHSKHGHNYQQVGSYGYPSSFVYYQQHQQMQQQQQQQQQHQYQQIPQQQQSQHQHLRTQQQQQQQQQQPHPAPALNDETPTVKTFIRSREKSISGASISSPQQTDDTSAVSPLLGSSEREIDNNTERKSSLAHKPTRRHRRSRTWHGRHNSDSPVYAHQKAADTTTNSPNLTNSRQELRSSNISSKNTAVCSTTTTTTTTAAAAASTTVTITPTSVPDIEVVDTNLTLPLLPSPLHSPPSAAISVANAAVPPTSSSLSCSSTTMDHLPSMRTGNPPLNSSTSSSAVPTALTNSTGRIAGLAPLSAIVGSGSPASGISSDTSESSDWGLFPPFMDDLIEDVDDAPAYNPYHSQRQSQQQGSGRSARERKSPRTTSDLTKLFRSISISDEGRRASSSDSSNPAPPK